MGIDKNLSWLESAVNLPIQTVMGNDVRGVRRLSIGMTRYCEILQSARFRVVGLSPFVCASSKVILPRRCLLRRSWRDQDDPSNLRSILRTHF